MTQATPSALQNKRALVIGSGLTGLSMARYLLAQGAKVSVADSRASPPNLEPLRALGISVATGPFAAALFEDIDLLAVSPGVALATPLIAEAKARGVDTAGDIELFARVCPPGLKVIAITGSNGKTTTASLTGALARAAGLKVTVAGNIGLPILDALAQWSTQGVPDLLVLELSSYQLETTTSLRCDVATVLNLSENHLDRYPSMLHYAAAKGRIFDHASVQVLNAHDGLVCAMRQAAKPSVSFGGKGAEWSAHSDALWFKEKRLLSVSALKLVGAHNHHNALAALALLNAVGIAPSAVVSALCGFEGLPHRMQRVAEIDGVLYVNDSKATTVAATQAALAGLTRRAIVILGGDGKGQSFVELAHSLRLAKAHAITLGRDAGLIEAALVAAKVPFTRVTTLEAAVAHAHGLAQSGDCVMLSPACASLDMFANYEARGEAFIQATQSLKAVAGSPELAHA